MAASSGKRCLYEILGLNRDCSPEEIRSSYRKLALQRHPDKLITQAGISEKEANAAFQELVNAYEVLSDPKERSWYDSHRNKILFSEPKTSSGSSSYSHSSVPDLFSYYSNSCYSGFGHTGKGFYKVYGDLFDKIYEQEVTTANKLGLGLDFVREAPLMGNLTCDYSQVTAFYNYWSGFSSVMEFWWADEHDVELGYDRKSRRLYEEQNKKCRKKAKKEYNETVRGLVEFVKKRDKRIVEMKMKKALEVEKKKEELKEMKKESERQKLERARLYEEPDWAKVEEEDIGLGFEEVDNNNNKKDEIKELYCVICSKKFKSDKQWKNHEQSKKHKEKVAMFRDEIGSDDQSEEEEIVNEVNEDMGPSVSGNDAIVDDLSEKFEDAFEFHEEEIEEVKKASIEEEEEEVDDEEEEEEEINHDNEAGNSGSDEESILLKAMLSRQKNRKKAASKRETEMPSSSETPDTTDGVPEFMVYDNMKKSARGNRRAKRGNGKNSNGNEVTEEVSSDSNIKHVGIEEGNEPDNSYTLGSSSDTVDEVGQKSRADPPPLGKNVKSHKKAVDKRGSGTEDMASNSRKASKGRKQKGASKSTDHLCDTCGQDFESRNKLHRHLGDTGHASLKSR